MIRELRQVHALHNGPHGAFGFHILEEALRIVGEMSLDGFRHLACHALHLPHERLVETIQLLRTDRLHLRRISSAVARLRCLPRLQIEEHVHGMTRRATGLTLLFRADELVGLWEYRQFGSKSDVAVVTHKGTPYSWTRIEVLIVAAHQHITKLPSCPSRREPTFFCDAIADQQRRIRHLVRQRVVMLAYVAFLPILRLARVQDIPLSRLRVERMDVVIHPRQTMLRPAAVSRKPCLAIFEPCVARVTCAVGPRMLHALCGCGFPEVLIQAAEGLIRVIRWPCLLNIRPLRFEFLGIRISTAPNVTHEVFPRSSSQQFLLQHRGNIFQCLELKRHLKVREEMQMQRTLGQLRFDGPNHRVGAACGASHRRAVATKHVHAWIVGLHAVRAKRTHPKTIQCWENDSACHFERLHTALRVSRGDKTTEVIVWEIDNGSLDPLIRSVFRWP